MSCEKSGRTLRRVVWAVGLALAALAALAAPPLAHAGLGDFFGIASAVTAVTEVTWKIYAIKTFAAMGPLILLIIAIFATIVAAWAIVHIGNSFSETLRTTLRDETVTRAEWGIILASRRGEGPKSYALDSLGLPARKAGTTFNVVSTRRTGTGENSSCRTPANGFSPIPHHLTRPTAQGP